MQRNAGPPETPDPIATLLDAATARLAGDRELRLDVRAELESHVTDRRAELESKGHSAGDALDLAVKSFGPAAELAEDLALANARRMKLRGLARLAARAVLVPAAVVVAALVIGGLTYEVYRASWLADAINMTVQPGEDDSAFMPPSVSEDGVFLFAGDKSRRLRSARQRAIWEVHPESIVYYGNYVMHLAGEFNSLHIIGDKRPSDADLACFTEEVGRGKEIDPGNARYGYLLAGALLAAGSEEEDEQVQGPDGKPRYEDKLIITDRNAVDRAMAELLEAATKPFRKTYARDMAAERLATLPLQSNYFDMMIGFMVAVEASAYSYADLAFCRRIVRAVPHLAGLLASEGRPADARRLLDTWFPFVKHIVGEAGYLDLLVAQAILGVIKTTYADAYEELGDHEEAERTRRWAGRLSEPIARHCDEMKRSKQVETAGDWYNVPRTVEESGSMYARMMLSLAPQDSEVLTPGRHAEHALLERTALSFMLVMTLMMLLGNFAAALRWRWSRSVSTPPLLLLPSWHDAARILGLGILLPIAVFYVYTRWSGLAGREYSFQFLMGRFLLELWLLGITILALTGSLAREALRERCRTLGIPAPTRLGRRIRLAGWIVLGAAWATCLGLREPVVAAVGVGVVTAVGMAAIVASAIIAAVRRRRQPEKYGLFRGTVARSLVPVFAAAAVLIGLVCDAYLVRREAALVRRDQILTLDAEEMLGKVEADLVRRLRGEMLQAIREVEDEKAQAE